MKYRAHAVPRPVIESQTEVIDDAVDPQDNFAMWWRCAEPRRARAACQNRRRWTSASESFLADVLALAGEEPDAVREGVRVALPSSNTCNKT